MKSDDKRFWDGELYKLLSSRITDCTTPRGMFSIVLIAKRMRLSTEGVYQYMRADRLTVDGAKRIIAASDGKITKDDLVEFLFH